MNYLKRFRPAFIYSIIFLAITNVAHANWKIDSTGLSGHCALVSPVLMINDGHGETKIQLKLNKDQMVVVTDSNIDNTMNDIGLQVDDNAFMNITEVIDTTHVSFGNNRIDAIITQFVPGRKVLIHLRFWPTWPKTGVKTAGFSLTGFTKALKSLAQCE